MVSVTQIPGNAEVVEALETLLAEARGGQTNYGIFSTNNAATGKAKSCVVGDVTLIKSTRKALEKLTAMADAEILKITLPDADPSLDPSYACYNAALGPLSYDAVVWLMIQEMRRIREGGPAPLKVCFFFGRDGKTGLQATRRHQMFANVIRPALALIGAVEDEAAVHGFRSDTYTVKTLVNNVRELGEKTPVLHAPPAAQDYVRKFLGGRFPVTITLRESDYWPHRNSNLDAWLRFAHDLVWHHGEEVIFVRDTMKAHEPIEGFNTFPLAAIDLHVRCALYEQAKANLFVSNGPASLASFGTRPWLQFLQLNSDGHPYKADTPSFLRQHMAMEPGDQYPWSAPDQRIVYAADEYENIVAAWRELGELRAAA